LPEEKLAQSLTVDCRPLINKTESGQWQRDRIDLARVFPVDPLVLCDTTIQGGIGFLSPV